MMAASMVKVLEEAVKERTELTMKHQEKVEWAKTNLDKVQTTYQSKLLEYEVQANATATLIKQLKDEKQATKDNTKLDID